VDDFFANDRVKLIVAAIGGDHACHLLPHLDFSLIERCPTGFVGFSDNTVLNVALWSQARLVTFNGPALLTDFGEYPGMLEYSRSWFVRALCDPSPLGALVSSPTWTEHRADWDLPDEQARPRPMLPASGWTFLKPGMGQGPLIGGCLESLQHLRGTRFWPDWTDAILFFETSEERPLPKTVDSILMDYENMGVLSKLSGLLVGRPMHYSEEQRAELRRIVLARTERFDFPIVTDMDFGHTAPQLTLPIGCVARIDSQRRSVEVLEPCTSEDGNGRRGPAR